MDVEQIKREDLVRWLSIHYGVKMEKQGSQYVGLSPLTQEKTPSFFVKRMSDGHWVFKDFSSDESGSIIDLVMKKEGLGLKDAIHHLGADAGISTKPTTRPKKHKTYDLEMIHRAIARHDRKPSINYLLGRGISLEVVQALNRKGMLLHNRYGGKSYCCFVVRNQHGNLGCLDNHEIEGPSKFVLGRKVPFSLDWAELAGTEEAFVCESIIDYLSLKTLEASAKGLALLGNAINFPRELLEGAGAIQSALDLDGGGCRALLDLAEYYPDKEILSYDFGSCKDLNEYLCELKTGTDPLKLSPSDKLTLFKDFAASKNKAEVARRWGINRSYMYEIVKECEQIMLDGFAQKKRGRPTGPQTLEKAKSLLAATQEEKETETREKEKMYARSEFLKLRLKWAEDELSMQSSKSKAKNRQLKKKKKRKS